MNKQPCVHLHWNIPDNDKCGLVAVGVCRDCGETKEFKNFAGDACLPGKLLGSLKTKEEGLPYLDDFGSRLKLHPERMKVFWG